MLKTSQMPINSLTSTTFCETSLKRHQYAKKQMTVDRHMQVRKLETFDIISTPENNYVWGYFGAFVCEKVHLRHKVSRQHHHTSIVCYFVMFQIYIYLCEFDSCIVTSDSILCNQFGIHITTFLE